MNDSAPPHESKLATLSAEQPLGPIVAEAGFDITYFVTSASWTNVRTRARSIVIGRKGTGKTAIRLALQSADVGVLGSVHTASLSFADYPWKAHYRVADGDVASRSRYKETWSFLLLVELAKLVVRHPEKTVGRSKRAAKRRLRRFLKQNWGGVSADYKRTLTNERTRVVSAELRPEFMSSGLGGVTWGKVKIENLGPHLRQTNEWLRGNIAAAFGSGQEYFVVLDDLDVDFESMSGDYTDSIIGLVLAVSGLHAWCEESSLPAHLVAVLRDDIYDRLQFHDKNKITTQRVERIRWETDEQAENSLLTVLNRRIEHTLDLKDIPSPFAVVFDSELMRGKQSKYAHMAQRTYLRPRDLLQFANECISVARADGRFSGSDRVANKDVTTARTSYSNYLRRELADEIHPHFPDWERWLEVLKQMGYMAFDHASFESARSHLGNAAGTDSSGTMLDGLYRFGIIGFSRLGGRGSGGSGLVWSYQNPDTDLDTKAKYYAVHPGLKENLELREGSQFESTSA